MTIIDQRRPTASAHRVDPTRGPNLREGISQTIDMAWRALIKMRRKPEQFIDVAVMPILFTVMFAYVFGGAISGDVKDYLPLMIPGILAQTVLIASMTTGTQLRDDMDKGVTDGSDRSRCPAWRRSPDRCSPTFCATRSRSC